MLNGVKSWRGVRQAGGGWGQREMDRGRGRGGGIRETVCVCGGEGFVCTVNSPRTNPSAGGKAGVEVCDEAVEGWKLLISNF